MTDGETQCGFCSKLGSQYLCPRCKTPYCSLKCYRSELHRKCSEDFYKECVVKELKETKHGSDQQAKEVQTFEEYMKKWSEGAKPSTSNSGANGDEEEEGEPLDSDDEDLKYLDTVTEKTLAEFEAANDDDLERHLTALGIGLEEDRLFAALNDSEKQAFTQLADQMNYDLSGFGNSVFKTKTGNRKSDT